MIVRIVETRARAPERHRTRCRPFDHALGRDRREQLVRRLPARPVSRRRGRRSGAPAVLGRQGGSLRAVGAAARGPRRDGAFRTFRCASDSRDAGVRPCAHPADGATAICSRTRTLGRGTVSRSVWQHAAACPVHRCCGDARTEHAQPAEPIRACRPGQRWWRRRLRGERRSLGAALWTGLRRRRRCQRLRRRRWWLSWLRTRRGERRRKRLWQSPRSQRWRWHGRQLDWRWRWLHERGPEARSRPP